MAEIKPDEISAILRQQLGNFNAGAELEEVGTVLQVGDGIARVYGLNNVRSGELVEFETGVKAIALNLEEDNVGVVLMCWVNPLMAKDLLQVNYMKCHWSVKRRV